MVAGIIIGVSGVIPVATIILSGVIEFGIISIFMSVVRNQPFEFQDLFKGFNKFGTTCGAGVLVALFTFLWSLLFIIPGIVKVYSYSMTFYILNDNPDITAREAISMSKEMMNGHKLDLFVLHLSFIGWYLLCIITFGIAALYVVPYVAASETAFYDAIKKQPANIG